jgi:hypothetical protein
MLHLKQILLVAGVVASRCSLLPIPSAQQVGTYGRGPKRLETGTLQKIVWFENATSSTRYLIQGARSFRGPVVFYTYKRDV